THLWFALSASMSLIACADEDPDQVINDHEIPGVQEPGSSAEIHRGCGTQDLSAREMAAIDLALAAQPTEIASLTASHVIPTYIHRIHASNGSGGGVTATQISNQISVLNAAY